MSRTGKRGLDTAIAWLLLPLLLPVIAMLACAILVADGRPALFRQQRVGRHGRPFTILKFRTMRPPGRTIATAITVGADPRITVLGSWLRRTKLDELPQLFNVLRGEMSFVGPRPEVPRYVSQYRAAERQVLELSPGITDPASIVMHRESELLAMFSDPERTYVDLFVPAKIRINVRYAAQASLASDLRVMLRTVAPRHHRRPADTRVRSG